MKTLFKLGNITMGEVTISDLTIEQDYTVTDIVELAYHGKSFIKELVKDLPELIDDICVAFSKAEKLDKAVKKESNQTEEDIWEVTSVKVSKVTDFVENFNCDLTVVHNQICQYIYNNVGNPNAIVAELYRLESVSSKAYIEKEINLETYKNATAEIEKLFETFNEAVRSF